MIRAADINQSVNASLLQLTDEVLKSVQTIAKENRTMLVNQVPATIAIRDRIYPIASVIAAVLDAVIRHSSDGKVLVSAKMVHSTTAELNVKDENCYDAYALAMALQPAVTLAKKTGGQLFITHQQKKITTIIFRFPTGA